MTDRIRALALFLASSLLIVSAGAHAVMGERFVHEIVSARAGVASLEGVLSAGWQLGSAALLVFGVLALLGGWGAWRGRPMSPAVLSIIAAALIAYGAGALVLGEHQYAVIYAGYVVVGILFSVGVVRQPA